VNANPQAGAAAGGMLFVTYGNGHIAKAAPVVKALRGEKRFVRRDGVDLGYRQAKRLGLAPVGYQGTSAAWSTFRESLPMGALLAGNSHPDVDERESLCYLGNYAE
jgi:hypothetical protein